MVYFYGLRPSAVEYQMLDALYLYDALNIVWCIKLDALYFKQGSSSILYLATMVL